MALNKLKKWIGSMLFSAFMNEYNDNVDATNAAIDLAESHIAESATDDVHGLRDRVIEGNGNGYMKIGNGIVVMWGQVSVARITSAGDYSIQWSYPVPLKDKPQLVLSTIQSANVTSATAFDRVIVNNQSTTNNSATAVLSTNRDTSYGFYVNFFAIGRWKN